VGFLDYYKQFEGMPEEEVNARLREQAAERKRKALAVVEPIDLSATTWPEYPHPAVVNAITYTARRGLHR
jgi:histidinol-phosphate aminotransferase